MAVLAEAVLAEAVLLKAEAPGRLRGEGAAGERSTCAALNTAGPANSSEWKLRGSCWIRVRVGVRVRVARGEGGAQGGAQGGVHGCEVGVGVRIPAG